ncbi:MAG: bacillithiol biosynthesis deacetylase BshB1 [Saprospiraceae bacterium]|nr:bacillithiol biosynthesis deacetylase BshB1 [Saprospiraceae bacterium]|tara:strand:- start:190 stop:909 length:720 start_codon:yes stop_codon:yes gene_type:complete
MKVKSEHVDILAFGVHPDDVELACSGTIMKHIAQGKTVGIIDFTRGELGTRGNGLLRLEEAQSAAQILGVEFRYNLNMRDGFFQIDELNTKKVAAAIRRHRPTIVLANSLEDRHPDHGRAAKLTREAAFYSGLSKINLDNLEPWRPKAIYHYIQDYNLTPDVVVDVSEFVDRKFEAIKAFSSQFFISQDDDDQTPISSKQFMDFLKAKMATYGRPIQADFAEGFNVTRAIGANDLLTFD